MNYYKKSTLLFGWLVFAISTLVYALTMEPSASLWDCGEFIATSYKMQVGHPPGAPLFMLINRIFTIFAADTSKVALMVNFASAVASGLTIAFLFWTIAHLSRRLLGKSEESIEKGDTWVVVGAALVGSLAYAFTDTFWFSAVEGEVYAQSSLFTAMVFWAILKWENDADKPHANRWIVLVAYLMGLSIGIHLLNLLSIPAIVFVYYYRLNPVRNKLGWWKAFGFSVVILATLLFIIIPKSVELGAWVDRVFVNTFSLPVNSGMATFALASLGGLLYGSYRAYQRGRVVLNTVLLSLAMLIFGYGSYATVVIRAYADTPMNSNHPDDPYALLSVLNRDQYEKQPLFTGQTYASPVIEYVDKVTYRYNDETKRYEELTYTDDVVYAPGTTVLFPRMYSSAHAKEYQNWVNVKGKRVRVGGDVVVIPTFAENLQYFFNYQLNFMYWRYFLWNFVGRQNDFQSQGEIINGGWMSGITPIDELYIGPQTQLPDEMADNTARNRYYFLPFILGIVGIMYQLKRDRNNFTVVMWLFIMTGVAIIVYLNQPPMQPRERDYAFAGSFYAFTIWIGLGVLCLYDYLTQKTKLSSTKNAVIATAICMVVPTILIAENWDDHDRSNRYIARDIGRNYLESTLPNTVLLPYGDNDTFPLWYSQEVEGVRTDIRVMNLSYLDSEWYAAQMRNRTYESAPVEFTLPKSFYDANTHVNVADIVKEPMTIQQVLDFLKNDSQVKSALRQRYGTDVIIPTRTIKIPVNKENAIKSGIILPEEAEMALDTITLTLKDDYIRRSRMALLDAIGTADWSRPFSFTQPFTISDMGLQEYFQIEGFTYRFVPFKSATRSLVYGRIDSDYLYDKLMNFEYGNIKDPRVNIDFFTEYTFNSIQIRNIAGRLAKQLIAEGDTVRAVEVLDRIMEEVPISKISHSYNSYSVIEAYYAAGKIAQADELLLQFADHVLQYLNYFSQFNSSQSSRIGNAFNENLMYLQKLYMIASDSKREEIVKVLEPYMVLLQE
ncbi:MAG: DUF2723 domain-containing protein [Rikenellaceae bacterium]